MQTDKTQHRVVNGHVTRHMVDRENGATENGGHKTATADHQQQQQQQQLSVPDELDRQSTSSGVTPEEELPTSHSAPDEISEHLLTESARQERLVAFVKDYRSRAEELTREVRSREMEVKRLSKERSKLRDELVVCHGRERELASVVADLEQCLEDLQVKFDEDKVMTQLKEVEYSQTVSTLERKVRQMTVENSRIARFLDSLSSAACCRPARRHRPSVVVQHPIVNIDELVETNV